MVMRWDTSLRSGRRPRIFCKCMNSLEYSTSTMRTTGSSTGSLMNENTSISCFSIVLSL